MASALILGASGRIGRMLRHQGLAGIAPLWQFRRASEYSDSIIFDPLKGGMPQVRCNTVLCLLGVVKGSPLDLQLNRDLAEAALRIGVASGARRVFLTSTAAVYGRAESPLSEDAPSQPLGEYGRAKVEMEDAALRLAAQINMPVTFLRIGNVAGADALLGQPESAAIILDRFADGQGPRRSYIGPRDLAAVVAALLARAAAGQDLPAILNLSLPGVVAMADLLQAAGRSFAWRPAPESALPLVALDTTRLAQIVPLPDASAMRIVADWQDYVQAVK